MGRCVMSALSTADISATAIAAEKERLAATQQRVRDLSERVAQLEAELAQAREEETRLSVSVRWRELMAAVNADDAVYGVTERLNDTFAAFRESLVEPEGYEQSQREELKPGEEMVPYSDTDDYADFSAVEAAVEDVLAAAKESLEAHAADPRARSSNRCSTTSSFAHRSKANRGPSSESAEAQAANEAARRQALLQLLVLTVLVGKVEEHCSFKAIPDPSNAPRTDAEELRDGVASAWQWLFYEQPSVLTEAERKEWIDIATTFLGDAYVTAP
jgi:hypothetical protein